MKKGCQKSHQGIGCRPAERTGADPAPDTELCLFSWQAAPLSAYVNPRAAEPQSPCCRGLTAQVGAPCVPHTPPLPSKPLQVFLGGSQPGKLEGGTYSAAKANHSSLVPWLPQASPDLPGWEE